MKIDYESYKSLKFNRPAPRILEVIISNPGKLNSLDRNGHRELADVWRETRKTVVYVTHNVAEAVYLADRVIVMSPHPGTVKAEIKIPLERPRDPLSAEFVEWQKKLLHHLGHEPGGDDMQTNGQGSA